MVAHGGFTGEVASRFSPDRVTDQDAKHLLETLTYYSSLVHGSFATYDNHAAVGFELIRDVWLENLGDPFFGALMQVVGLVFNPDDDERWANLVKELGKLIDQVADSGNVWSGAHANGWLAKSLKDKANSARQRLAERTMPGDAAKVGSVVDSSLAAFSILNTRGQDPWLRADNQIKFEGVCRCAAMALNAM